jgi:hypothetical protein
MIINLAMKSHGFPLTTLRIFLLTITTCVLAAYAIAADKKAPPAKPANQYAAFDAHPDEHVTIAAEPCDDTRDCPFFRLPYIQHSLLPVRVIVTNDSDTVISLDDARIQFISVNRDVLPAADLDDINRRLFSTKNAAPTKVPLIPVPIHHAPVDKKITEDDNDFGFPNTRVQPHTTLAGYLFYDIRGLEDPALKGAELYVKMVHTLDGSKQLFAFSIPFNKWLAANSPAPQKSPDKPTQKD